MSNKEFEQPVWPVDPMSLLRPHLCASDPSLELIRELRDASQALLDYEAAMDGADGCGENDGMYWQAIKLARAAVARATALSVAPEVARKRLSLAEANAIETEMRCIEGMGTKRELRFFMQSLMPCGHAVGNLLTCDTPPVGCVICGEPSGEEGNS